VHGNVPCVVPRVQYRSTELSVPSIQQGFRMADVVQSSVFDNKCIQVHLLGVLTVAGSQISKMAAIGQG
jgi:hypothetical protein